MEETLAIALLTNGKFQLSSDLFVEKKFEAEFITMTHLYVLDCIYSDQSRYEEYQYLFFGEGRYNIPYRNNYIRKVIKYVNVMAGLIWFTSGGATPAHFEEDFCKSVMSAIFNSTQIPIDYDTVAEAKVLMNEPLGVRNQMMKSIVEGRKQNGKRKIQEGRTFSTLV